jgi:hypothetical protein
MQQGGRTYRRGENTRRPGGLRAALATQYNAFAQSLRQGD